VEAIYLVCGAGGPQLKRNPLGGCMRAPCHFLRYSACATLLVACSRGRLVAPTPNCVSSWHPVWTSDSSIALCVPADFVRADFGGWGRPGVGTGFLDFLSVELLSWPRDSLSLGQWPPHVASGANCLADCSTADSVTIHIDSLAGMEVRTEVGLVTGGEPGFHRKPVLEGGWIVKDSIRGFAHGWATHGATLDTLRSMLGTVRLAQGKH
jgi:hypothetical protein